MRKFVLVVTVLLFCVSAEAAEKLKIRRITSTTDMAHTPTQAISTDNIASRLLFASVSCDHPSSNATLASLSIFDGTTERVNLNTEHITATWGPFPREDAPIFDTDIAATLGANNINGTNPMSSATFVYIEME